MDDQLLYKLLGVVSRAEVSQKKGVESDYGLRMAKTARVVRIDSF